MVCRCAYGLDLILRLIFVTFFAFFRRRYYQKMYIVDTLCAQFLLQFYADLFEILSGSEDVHVVWILSSD